MKIFQKLKLREIEVVKNKKVIIILSAILIMPVTINELMSISTPWTKGEIGDWISFYGSYIGALSGALVAFQVTKMQIKAQDDLSKKLKFNEQLSTLIILKVEIEDIQKSILSIYNYIITYFNENNINDYSFVNIDNPLPLTIKYWDSIEKIIDTELIRKLVRFRKEYNKVSESLSYNMRNDEMEIVELSIKLNSSILKIEEKSKLNERIKYLQDKLEVNRENKRYSWNKIVDNSVYKLSQDIIKEIDRIIKKIEA